MLKVSIIGSLPVGKKKKKKIKMGKEIVSRSLLDGHGVKGLRGITNSFSTPTLGAWDAGE